MSSHYIYLACSAAECATTEMLYTGDVYSSEFDDSGPDSWEGETIAVLCKNCQEEGRVATISPAVDAQGYLAKTLDNIEESEAHWTAAEVRELLNDTLNLLAGKAIE